MEFPYASLMAPLSLLMKERRHWLPLVVALAMFRALPEIFFRFYLPDTFAVLTTVSDLNTNMMLAGVLALGVLLSIQLLIELVCLMFAFVILADITAGRSQDLSLAMRKLASWRLQGVWLVAGLFEQAAMSLWYLGGGALLVPTGMVTTASYEEGTGMQAFQRSYELGMAEQNGSRPGVRIAVGTTLAYLLNFLVTGVFSVFAILKYWPMLMQMLGGELPPLDLLHYSWGEAVEDLVLSPIGMMPAIYMMCLQQVTYWEARRFEEAQRKTVTR